MQETWCNGAGKSAWKRANYDALPDCYMDQDSVAGGLGDWDDQDNRDRTQVIVDCEIDSYVQNLLDFGIESTFSGCPGVAMLNRVIDAGYRTEGIYMGTETPSINIARIEYRTTVRVGHTVDPNRVPQRYRYSLSNLRQNFDRFDQLELIDNSDEDDDLHLPQPIRQCVVLKGSIEESLDHEELAVWCKDLLNRIEQAKEQTERQKQLKEERQRARKGRMD